MINDPVARLSMLSWLWLLVAILMIIVGENPNLAVVMSVIAGIGQQICRAILTEKNDDQ